MPPETVSEVYIGDSFKDLVWDVLIKAALAILFKAIPFLGWGPIGALVSVVVKWFADKLYELVKETFELQKIAFTNLAHLQAYQSASLKLKLIARDKGIDSHEFQEARSVHRKTLSFFVRFGPR